MKRLKTIWASMVFLNLVAAPGELLFGKGNAIIADKRARTAQTPGGTGALRVAADFLAKNTDVKRVWVSNPSWPNHKSVFTSAGLEVREYAYYDAANHALDFDGLLASLNEAQCGRRGTVPRLLPQPDRYRSDTRSVAAAGAAVGGKRLATAVRFRLPGLRPRSGRRC